MPKSVHSSAQKALGAALVAARDAAGMSQQKLAKELKRSQSFVTKYENGERRLDVIELLQIARVLNADYKRILRAVDDTL